MQVNKKGLLFHKARVITIERKSFALHDIVEMKKPHPCGTNAWQVIRMGMDIRMKCTGCGHSVLLPRSRFEKRLKKVLVPAAEEGTESRTPPKRP